MDTDPKDNSRRDNMDMPSKSNSQKQPLDHRICGWLEQGARVAIAVTVFLFLLKHLAGFLLEWH